MLSNAGTKSADLTDARETTRSSGSFVSRKIWLPKGVYDALPALPPVLGRVYTPRGADPAPPPESAEPTGSCGRRFRLISRHNVSSLEIGRVGLTCYGLWARIGMC